MPKITTSPWGKVQDQREIADGITKVSTASHGGLLLSPERYAKMPASMKATAYSGEGWYEEEADWALVATVFPEAFTVQQQAFAASIMSRYFPDITA